MPACPPCSPPSAARSLGLVVVAERFSVVVLVVVGRLAALTASFSLSGRTAAVGTLGVVRRDRAEGVDGVRGWMA